MPDERAGDSPADVPLLHGCSVHPHPKPYCWWCVLIVEKRREAVVSRGDTMSEQDNAPYELHGPVVDGG